MLIDEVKPMNLLQTKGFRCLVRNTVTEKSLCTNWFTMQQRFTEFYVFISFATLPFLSQTFTRDTLAIAIS